MSLVWNSFGIIEPYIEPILLTFLTIKSRLNRGGGGGGGGWGGVFVCVCVCVCVGGGGGGFVLCLANYYIAVNET